MMKIVASLIILGLCVSLASGAALAPASSGNSGSFASSVLNSSAVKVWSQANTTDATNWNPTKAADAAGTGVLADWTWFGPGTKNDTSYVYAITSGGYAVGTSTAKYSGGTGTVIGTPATASTYQTTSLRKRTINNTIAGYGNDTTEASVVSDTAVSVSFMGQPSRAASAVGPGYLALLTTGLDGAGASATAAINQQVWITLISGSAGSATTTKLTSISDVYITGEANIPAASAVCTVTSFTLGNVWYDIGSGAFFYTYNKKIDTAAANSGAGTCGASSAITNTIYLGGIYVNGTKFWTNDISVSAVTATVTPQYLLGGSDNWLNSTNIYLVYKDSTASTLTTYSSKTTKATATTAVGSFSSLLKDPADVSTASTATYLNIVHRPIAVWTSNYTYGITLGQTNTTGSSNTVTYGYVNFFNGTTTGVVSTLTSSSASGLGTYGVYPLNTGFAVIATYSTGTVAPIPTTYITGSFFANNTVNTTSATLGSTTYSGGAAQFYADVNGSFWIGWQDIDTATGNDAAAASGGGKITFAGYLGKLAGQIYPTSTGANILATIVSFAVLFIASIFAF